MSLTPPPKLRRLQEALYTKAKQEPGYRFYLLYDKVIERTSWPMPMRSVSRRVERRAWTA